MGYGNNENFLVQIDNKELKDRLDGHDMQLAENVKYNAQIDFVEFIKNHSKKYSKMSFRKISDSAYKVSLRDELRHITYQFKKDNLDDFIKLDTCSVGTLTHLQYDKDYDDVRTGTWVTTSGSHYTTQLGATFTVNLKGETLKVYILSESRGGLWEVVVDGDTTNKKYVSCYSPTTINPHEVEFVNGLDYDKEHTCVFTFLGDDPDNPPSSSPSRGYVVNSTNVSNGCVTGYVKIGSDDVVVLAAGSNKEFAFSVSKDGSTNWIPEHNSVGSAFAITPAEFYLDDVLIDSLSLPVDYYTEINKFELKQKVNGQIPAIATNVMEITTTHKIEENGLLMFNGASKALTDVVITGYSLMLPANSAYANEFISGILNSKVSLGDETETYFTEEKDRVFSGAVISSSNRNIIGAGTLLYPIKSYRIGKSGKPTDDSDLFVWNRASTPKMYFKSMQGAAMNAGDFYAWGFQVVIGEIDNVYDFIKS